jgi:hypothetical protein
MAREFGGKTAEVKSVKNVECGKWRTTGPSRNGPAERNGQSQDAESRDDADGGTDESDTTRPSESGGSERVEEGLKIENTPV